MRSLYCVYNQPELESEVRDHYSNSLIFTEQLRTESVRRSTAS